MQGQPGFMRPLAKRDHLLPDVREATCLRAFGAAQLEEIEPAVQRPIHASKGGAAILAIARALVGDHQRLPPYAHAGPHFVGVEIEVDRQAHPTAIVDQPCGRFKGARFAWRLAGGQGDACWRGHGQFVA